MINSTVILGSTGSIGRQSVEVCKRLGIKAAALTTNKNIDLLLEQTKALRPEYVCAFDAGANERLRAALQGTGVAVGHSGEAGLIEAATWNSAECVVTAVSGAVGLRPTLAAIDAKKRIALANKETLVCAGSVVMARAREKGAEIVPVDSEHSAVFQCLTARRGELRKVLLTGSGGPFRGWSREETARVTPEMAVKHPNWSMGAKISVDSATMMNKGLEFIEAMRLYHMPPEKISVVVHRESIVHSLVEYCDNAVLAQLGAPDMRLPIQYALTWPARAPGPAASLDLLSCPPLTFAAPDCETFECLALALQAAAQGGTAPAVLSGANEAAVDLFLREEIGFLDIPRRVGEALERVKPVERPSLEDILLADHAAREAVRCAR